MDELEKLNSTIIGEANRILYDHGLLQVLGKYGNPVLTGSYVLELMTWRDLDIYLETDEMTESRFFQLGAEIAWCLKPQRMHYRNEFIGKTPNLPVGFYWGTYVTGSDFPEEWKIDLWAIDSEQKTILQKGLDELRVKINEDKKPVILMIKNHFCKHTEYRRKFTSMDIYLAVIEEDIMSIEEFARWLEKNKEIII
ncbi:hypothetical protein ES703_18413 [subsurface metagenome]